MNAHVAAMMPRETQSSGGLRCLGGRPGPPELGAHLATLTSLSPEALKELWHVLGPSLAEPVDPTAEKEARAFCGRHGVAPSDLSRAVRACRFVLRAAARVRLSAEDFDADLVSLETAALEPAEAPPGLPWAAIRQVLRAGFDLAMTSLRREILKGSLADHGRVLLGVDWRVDRMLASERGDLDVQVAVLTMHVQEGPERERLTLQLLPDDLRMLRDLCDRLLT